MFDKKTIRDINLKSKQVLLRADYNLPLDEKGQILSDYRLQQSLPTLKYLLDQRAKIVICAHLGRPKGRVDSKYSLQPVAQRLADLLGQEVQFIKKTIGPEVAQRTAELQDGQIAVLENLRFHPEEEQNDPDFAEKLAQDTRAEVFIQDGFGVAHRNHASTSAISQFLPSVAGLLLEKEVSTITEFVNNPKKPLMAIIGGAKIADKLPIIKRFIQTADYLVIGGAMANTFLKSQGIEVGESLYDQDELDTARDILEAARQQRQKRDFILYLPQDAVVAEKISSSAKPRIVDWDTHSVADIEAYPGIPRRSTYSVHKHEKILDIGPFSSAFIIGMMQSCNSVVWNGTVGITDVPALHGPVGPFGHGSEAILHALAGRYGKKPQSLIGGGDTVGFVQNRGLVEMLDHVSTGGGASLELMNGLKLPALEVLEDKENTE